MRKGWKSLAAVAAVLWAGVAIAGEHGLEEYGAFGIDQENGTLVRYYFDESSDVTYLPLGVLQHDGSALLGIQGATHVPTHTRMFFAFWTDETGQTNLLHVMPSRAATDETEIVGAVRPIEGGKVTGAASFFEADGVSTRTFILQRESAIPTYNIDGRININPGSTAQMRFEFRRVTDAEDTLVQIDRGHLNNRQWQEANGHVDGDGHFVVFDDVVGEGEVHDYETHTSLIQVRPKSDATQDEIEIVSDTGQTFELQNSNTYNLNGKLRVRIYNDRVDNEGMAMGKWWLELYGEAQFDQSEVGTVNRIAELDATLDEPLVTEAAVLDSTTLAGLDVDQDQLIGLGGRLDAEGRIELYVATASELYRIRPTFSESGAYQADSPVVEHVMTLTDNRDLRSLDFAGSALAGVDGYSSGRFVVLDTTGNDTILHSLNKPGPHTLGAIVLMPADVADAMMRPNYD